MLAAMRTSRRIDFSAYVLWPGPVERALENAARRGTEVHVRLEGRLYHGTPEMRKDNSDALHRLQKLRVDAKMVDRADADGPRMHLKAAVCDGAAFLDDCNWNGGDIVIRDDNPEDVAAVRAAALHRPEDPPPGLALNKTAALQQEAGVLGKSRATQVDVETEAVGKTGVSKVLRALAARGVRCRLLLSQHSVKSDFKTIASLERDGVEIRALAKSEKFAVAGDRAWVGSADATSPYYNRDQIEWGIGTRDSRIVDALQRRFDANWRRAKTVTVSC
jgi:phosphatidylserine/phosphatidylglycerophosphate/cardiolipin synthase-like enzyme